MATRDIEIRGARVHNLKNVSCRIPHRKLTVITGPSGSGKSSLAFDTLYAEGQRRYVESMSAYARQFLERIDKPDVDDIRHILPAIALEQKNSVKNARSTVGTATEIDDYLRVLYATLGNTRCDACGGAVFKADVPQILQQLATVAEGSKLLIFAPVPKAGNPLGQLQEQGYYRQVNADGSVGDLTLDSEGDTLAVLIDRIIVKKDDPQKAGGKKGSQSRLAEALQNAFNLSNSGVGVYHLSQGTVQSFQREYACQDCHKSFPEPFPHLFSFNHPQGACPTCEGFGRIMGVDMHKVIPNKGLSLRDGAVHPFTTPANADLYSLMVNEGRKRKVRLEVPYETLTEKEKAFVMDGGGEYPGVRGFFDWLETKKYKVHVRVMLARYRDYTECPDCKGTRLRREALNVFLAGKTLPDLCNTPVGALPAFLAALPLSDNEARLTERVRQEIQHRLQYLVAVGLGYLTLARQSRTLSGGESQRINLSTALGSRLTQTLYVLDEPTVGLHARDTDQLLRVLQDLRDLGNTLVLVEHDPDMMRGADHILDIGPTGGEDGGRLVYEGDYAGLLDTPYSLTARYLHQPAPTPPRPAKPTGWVEIVGASGNNLKNLTVKLPKGQLVCITGVSGSGKSTLLKQTLYAGYQRSQGQQLTLDVAPHEALQGLESFQDVILVDQSPPGRSQRSNPVTYVKAWDDIRTLFGEARKSMVLGLTSSDFSFNTPGGRCETCQGLGTVTIDMQFMADVTVVCPDCKGRRFNENVLSVDLFGKNINDILNLTVDEALKFFKTALRVRKKLQPLQDIGLGYLRLGQSTATLSGGEAQRLKLSTYLNAKETGTCLFLFDEPTTGLHLSDIHLLVQVFRRLLEAGHSVMVIEHNLDFVVQTDHILDLGPEGGQGGGYLVAQGSLEDIMACEGSHTGAFLRQKVVNASPVPKPASRKGKTKKPVTL